MLSETSGYDGELDVIENLPTAACSADLCMAHIVRAGRQWNVLATRSTSLLDFEPLRRICAQADIVVSERRLPRTCIPRWFRADRALLERTGGLAVTLGTVPEVATVAERVGRHPWAP
jgi:competence protein ComEC